jgi:dipeptidyl aminopeptidase/acylaminoacyl peptidase
MTTNELERELRTGLRETLDAELGPDPTWAESPAARRAAALDRSRRRWPLRVLAVAAVIGAAGGAALLAGAPRQPAAVSNGWVAYTVFHEDPAGGDPDTDIWFTALNQQPRRVIGTDTDSVDQACPAFSPDGHSLAYGRVEGLWSTMTAATRQRPAYRNAALVIADVAEDGTVAERRTIDVGDGLPPPCPVWSPDGRQLAFGVPLTSPINPERSGEGSEVWVVRPADGGITVIPDLLATDLEWSPDGSILAIAGGIEAFIDGLRDSRIHLYEPSTGTLRTLEDTLGVSELTWSPVGARIAYSSGQPTTGLATGPRLRIVDVETGHQDVLTAAYSAIHGIGPVWSPDGKTITYQRRVRGERHEVVLLTPDDRSVQTGLANEVVMPQRRTTADGSSVELWPWRVTWSPDGKHLLYVAWTYPNGCCGEGTVEQTLMVAVPTDPGAPAVILADNILSYDSGDTMRVPIQIWGRR